MSVELSTHTGLLSPSWLNLGQKLKAGNVQDALEQAGLNWTVSKRPVVTIAEIPEAEKGNPKPLTSNGTKRVEDLRYHLGRLLRDANDVNIRDEVKAILEETENAYIPHVNEFSIVRDDTNTPFGVLGRVYECLNNEECIAILQPLLDEGQITIERAGVLNGGANVWVIAKFPKIITVGTEELDQYMKLSWSHDGTEKLSATFIAIHRTTHTQICPTLRGANVSIDIRHTTNAKQRMEMAKQLLAKGDHYFGRLEEDLNQMVNLPWTAKEMEEYLHTLIPDSGKPKLDDHGRPIKKVTQASRKRDEVMDIYQHSDHDIEGTSYAAYLAVCQWCDHEKPTRVTGFEQIEDDAQLEIKRNEARMQSIWRGTSRKLKDTAFKIILK